MSSPDLIDRIEEIIGLLYPHIDGTMGGVPEARRLVVIRLLTLLRDEVEKER